MNRGSNPSASRPAVQWVTIDAQQQGQRLDNFLLRVLKGVPKTHIYRILRKGEVRVNRGRSRPSYRLQAGDQVRIPPVRQAVRPAAQPPAAQLERLRGAILYEDQQVLVLNKPAGWAVHGGSGLGYGIIDLMQHLRPDTPLALAHRLDRGTSGCLLIAKQRAALLALHEDLRQGAVEKTYLLAVRGQWPAGERRVDAPLAKNVLQGGERRVVVRDDGKSAQTVFRRLAVYRDASLLEARILTGRTHQIRVHAAHLGHPVAGDDKYGDSVFNRRLRGLGLQRLFLHAHRIVWSAGAVDVSAPLDAELQHLIEGWEGQR